MIYILLLVLLLVATIIRAQESLFKSISTTDQYIEYDSAKDFDDDGTYVIKERMCAVKFQTKYLPTGEEVEIKAIIDDEDNKGKSRFLINVTSKDAFVQVIRMKVF